MVTAHAPDEHVEAALARTQRRPHAPQFAVSVRRLASQPVVASWSQSAKPMEQLATAQPPLAQVVTAVCARAQPRPQAPQFVGSFCVLAQYADAEPVHAVSGAAQVVPQVPPEQTWPAGQLVPQVPQLPLSACVLTSQPLAATPSQSAKPGAQAPMAQVLAAHIADACGRTHARPQAPQLLTLSVVLLSQPFDGSPSQSPKPVAQRTTLHDPAVQPAVVVCGREQARPHMPQLAGSTAVFAQYAPSVDGHVASDVAQLVAQVPREQTCPEAQARPQLPQLSLSVCRLTQVLPHCVRAAEHDTAQTPAVHVVPARQAFPHAPQLLLSVCRSRHVPLHVVWPTAQETWQCRSRQRCPEGHTVPQAPQLLLSVVRSAQRCVEPASAPASPPPHVANVEAHVSEHRPRLHTWPPAQAWPQRPQLALSVCTFTQVPLHAVAPPGHESWHVPLVQSIDAPQALPQAPQFAVSLRVSTQVAPHRVADPVQAMSAPASIPVRSPTTESPVQLANTIAATSVAASHSLPLKRLFMRKPPAACALAARRTSPRGIPRIARAEKPGWTSNNGRADDAMWVQVGHTERATNWTSAASAPWDRAVAMQPAARRFSVFFKVCVAALSVLGASAAEANGRFPAANYFVAGPGATNDVLLLRTTFGLQVSRNGGRDWSWVCEEAFASAGSGDPSLAIGAGGTAVVATFAGLFASASPYCAWPAAAGAPAQGFGDLANTADGTHLVALLGPSGENALYVSADGGQSWSAGAGLHGFFGETVDVAPSDPRRVYVTAYASGGVAVLLRSDDGGMSVHEVTRTFGVDGSVYVAGVDARRSDVLYLRGNDGLGTVLFESDDGGFTLRRIGATRGTMLGFALSDDGRTVWTASTDAIEGLQRSVAGGPWTRVGGSVSVKCLRYHAGVLFVCADEVVDGWSLGWSADAGDHIAPLLSLRTLQGPSAECPASSPVTTLCGPRWDTVSRPLRNTEAGAPPTPVYLDAGADAPAPPTDLGPAARDAGAPAVDTATTPADAGIPDAADAGFDAALRDAGAPSTTTSGGCGCRVSTVADGRGAGLLAAALALWSRRRRRRS